MCKIEGDMYIDGVANAIAFSILVIEITYCKLTGKNVIAVSRFRMR